MAETDATVAIYWDFENVHACVLDGLQGKNTYRDSGWTRHKRVVDISRVVEYAASFGRVVVHRAYGNWQFFADYSASLQEHAIDLVQLFPLTKTKNGADIRLAVDAIDDLRGYPLVSHVVVVSSDCDYTALAQRCRSHGRRYIGVGSGPVADAYRFACDEFRRYQDLPASPRFVSSSSSSSSSLPSSLPSSSPSSPSPGTAGGGAAGATLDGAGDLVEQAVRRLAAENGGPWVIKAAVLPAVQRLDPAFSYRDLGFAAFPELVSALGGRIVERPGQYDHELAVRADLPVADDDADVRDASSAEFDPAVAAGAAGAFGAFDPLGPVTPAALIEGLLKRKKQRLPADKQLLWTGPELIAEIFAAAPDGIVASFDSLWQQLAAAADARGGPISEAEFKKLKAILWRAHAFEPLGFALGLRLREPDVAALRLRAVATLLRLLPEPAEVAQAVLAEAIFGPGVTPEQRDLIGAALLALAEHPEGDPDPGEPGAWESAA